MFNWSIFNRLFHVIEIVHRTDALPVISINALKTVTVEAGEGLIYLGYNDITVKTSVDSLHVAFHSNLPRTTTYIVYALPALLLLTNKFCTFCAAPEYEEV